MSARICFSRISFPTSFTFSSFYSLGSVVRHHKSDWSYYFHIVHTVHYDILKLRYTNKCTIFLLIQNRRDPIWIKRQIDVCEQELTVTETHTSVNQNKLYYHCINNTISCFIHFNQSLH